MLHRSRVCGVVLALLWAGVAPVAVASSTQPSRAKSGDWDILRSFSVGDREMYLVLRPESKRLRMVWVIGLARDINRHLMNENESVRYADVSIKVFARSGKEIPVTRYWESLEFFTPIEAGIGSNNGEYSLPVMKRTNLGRAVVTFQGHTATIPLQHSSRP
jgi:hypothetical protein